MYKEPPGSRTLIYPAAVKPRIRCKMVAHGMWCTYSISMYACIQAFIKQLCKSGRYGNVLKTHELSFPCHFSPCPAGDDEMFVTKAW